jgi:hypothetical protein
MVYEKGSILVVLVMILLVGSAVPLKWVVAGKSYHLVRDRFEFDDCFVDGTDGDH